MDPPEEKSRCAVNRKLIRPSLHEIKDQINTRPMKKRVSPPDQTHAETFYYLKQMQTRTPMVVVLESGEEIHGIIEWYDKDCIKLNRNARPNLLIMKRAVKYLYKKNENGHRRTSKEAEGEPDLVFEESES
jgi:sRNA-binding regulator protein Hfq